MARKTKTQEVVVEVDTVEEATAPKKKRVVRKKKPSAKVVQAPQITYGSPTDNLNALTVHKKVSAVRLKDNGDVDLTQITKKEKEKYLTIASSLDSHDMMSISGFGSDLSTVMGTQTNSFLKRQLGRNNSNEVTKLLNNLLAELQLIDINDLKQQSSIKRFMAQIPLIKKLITSIDTIKAKYTSIEKNVDGIVQKMQEAKLVVLSDNNMLEQLFQNNKDYTAQLTDIIIAGKLKLCERAALYGRRSESCGVCKQRVCVYRRERVARAEGREDASRVDTAARNERRFQKLRVLIHAHCAHRASEVCRVYHYLRIAAQERAAELLRRGEELFKIRPVEYEIGKLGILRSCQGAFRLDHRVGQNRRQTQIFFLREAAL